ncbi:hypothetical protein EDB80DRAFT_399026 [Ilyonectria destructans]|nr:hypothetical protein EDB80DRAFT_399026 [Ilyonectria destructans]
MCDSGSGPKDKAASITNTIAHDRCRWSIRAPSWISLAAVPCVSLSVMAVIIPMAYDNARASGWHTRETNLCCRQYGLRWASIPSMGHHGINGMSLVNLVIITTTLDTGQDQQLTVHCSNQSQFSGHDSPYSGASSIRSATLDADRLVRPDAAVACWHQLSTTDRLINKAQLVEFLCAQADY